MAKIIPKILVWLMMFCPLSASAQFVSWDDFLEQLLMETECEGEEGAAVMENLYDDYVYLHANPININQADSTELQQLGFLTGKQIEGIHYYIYRYGALRSVGELMLIPELDYHTRQLLSYFVTFGELEEKEDARDTWHRMLTRGKSELSTRLDIPLYRRAGYAPRTLSQLEASPSRYYTGNALYHNIRYNYRYDTRLSWGLSTEKDAGEPIFTATSPLPDHLSGYIQLGDMGILQSLIVGNYRLRFGQGLILNSDFALGKNMLLQGLGRQSPSIKPHRGTSESDYYTGAAATVAWHSWQFTAFASYRRLDATLDGVGISTLKSDGYHRTPLEQARRGNTRGNLFGAHIGYAAHGFHIGMTAMYQSFNRNFALPEQAYKRYAPQGHDFFNASVDYAWHHHRLSIVGETAIDKKGAIATLNTLRLKVVDGLHLTLLQRHYAHDFWALESKSFSSSSEIRNEQGIYLGVEWQPYRRIQITAYADGYHFPYLRYRVSTPSYGTDGIVNTRYTINDSHSILLRYRFRLKQRDVADGYRLPDGGLLNEWTHRLRLQWSGTLTPPLTCQALLEGCFVQAETLSMGVMAGAQTTYSPTLGCHALRFSAGVTAFCADYTARLYGYEQGLLYAYNYQMYYGTGLRGYLFVQYSHKKAPRFTGAAKVGATRYFDRNTIGSGAAMIDANHREDIQLQLRYSF
ncbi:MAG: helix-hairpin-helix domain-containing protein [Bacteroidaceae bacterium]|nr:helix-hairpin-helix domain-containing protein [Bacteroidaceae bacterium]